MQNNQPLRDILTQVFYFGNNEGGSKYGLHPEDALAAIRKLLEERIVPDEQYREAGWSESLTPPYTREVAKGYSPEQVDFNRCREEVLKRIKELA